MRGVKETGGGGGDGGGRKANKQSGRGRGGNGVGYNARPFYGREKKKRHWRRKRKAAYKNKSVANFSFIGISSCQV